MKELPLVKVWTGDGFAANPITLKQVKRNEMVAIYERFRHNGTQEGYEVFIIKKRLKGQALPGGLFELEDREVYPSAGQFGKTAWHVMTLERANEEFEEYSKAPLTEEEEAEENKLNLPEGEFTVKEVIELNDTNYISASLFVKAGVADGSIKYLREERRNVKGKPSKIYSKA